MTTSQLRILIVDDDPEVRETVFRALAKRGIGCEGAGSAASARRILSQSPAFDVILLDIQLDNVSGMDMLQQMRGDGIETPIIFVTGTTSLGHKLRGFEIGADDYITKPFHPRELVARIEAVVRRGRAVPTLEFGNLRLDPSTRTLHRGSQRIALSPREFDLVRVLMQARGLPVSRAELLRRVWAMDFEPGTSVVEVLVSRVRRKLEDGTTRLCSGSGKGYWIATCTDEAS